MRQISWILQIVQVYFLSTVVYNFKKIRTCFSSDEVKKLYVCLQCNRELKLSLKFYKLGKFKLQIFLVIETIVKTHSIENVCKWRTAYQMVFSCENYVNRDPNKHRKMKSGFLEVRIGVYSMLGTGNIQMNKKWFFS